jgi:hypothetical protein
MAVIIDGTAGVTTPGVTNSGTDAAAVQTYNGVAMPRMVLSTAQNTTSGTSIDFTSIPSWVKRITVMLNGVSTNGGSVVQVQLGSGSVTASGYNAAAAYAANGTAIISAAYSSGFGTVYNGAADIRHGAMTLTNISGNTWVAAGTLIAAAGVVSMAGSIALSGTLDRLRITTVNGTDTFDAGSVNILYEG